MPDADAVRAAWDRDGYVVVPGLLDRAAVAVMRREVAVAAPLEDGPNPLSKGPMEFRTNLFPGSAPIRDVLAAPEVVALLTAVLGPDVWCRWDQAVAKRPGAGWFPWHQDNGYTHRDAVHAQRPWLALTPSRADNGGLLVVPGAHRSPLPHRWDGGHAVAEPPGEGVAVDAAPGDAVLFSSLLPHATGPNTSSEERWAYVAEFLPLAEDDPTAPHPRFVVARDGAPAPGFEVTA